MRVSRPVLREAHNLEREFNSPARNQFRQREVGLEAAIFQRVAIRKGFGHAYTSSKFGWAKQVSRNNGQRGTEARKAQSAG